MLNTTDLIGLYLIGKTIKGDRYYCPKCGSEVTPYQTICFTCGQQFRSGHDIAVERSNRFWTSFGWWVAGICLVIVGLPLLWWIVFADHGIVH